MNERCINGLQGFQLFINLDLVLILKEFLRCYIRIILQIVKQIAGAFVSKLPKSR